MFLDTAQRHIWGSWPEPHSMVVTIWAPLPALYHLLTGINCCRLWIPIYLPLMAWASTLCHDYAHFSCSLLHSNLEVRGLVFFILSFTLCLDQCFIQRWHWVNMCWVDAWIKGSMILNKRYKIWGQRWIQTVTSIAKIMILYSESSEVCLEIKAYYWALLYTRHFLSSLSVLLLLLFTPQLWIWFYYYPILQVRKLSCWKLL